MHIPVETNHFHSVRFFLDGSQVLQSSNLVLHFRKEFFFYEKYASLQSELRRERADKKRRKTTKRRHADNFDR